MKTTEAVQPVSVIVSEPVQVLGSVTTGIQAQPESTLAGIFVMFSEDDTAEQIAAMAANRHGQTLAQVAEIIELPVATITAYTEARAALLQAAAAFPVDVWASFTQARAALLTANDEANEKYQ